ncbi:MAG TPA: hypothetical protein VKU00_02840 [Chthonomonadaceae bacterium]|nr:hypothetical protein [Chthonomonadaceae bacterium]
MRSGWIGALICVLMLICGLSLPLRSCRADTDAADGMTQAVSGVAETARKIQDKTRYGYDDNISLLGAYLKADTTITLTRQFKKGEKYALLGSGDGDAQEVDIYVNNAANERVAEDAGGDAQAIIEFEPARTGKFSVVLKLHRSKAKASFCTLAILRKGGWNVPDSNFVDAMAKCIAICSRLGRDRKDLHYTDQANQWSLFGGVLESQQDATLPNITLGSGKRIVVAAGDGNAQEVGLFLLSNRGDVVEKDSGSDATSIFEYKTNGSNAYGIRVKNAKSKGPSMILAAILAE